MRRWSFFILSIFLLAALAAHAQESAQPVSLNEQCAVPADTRWTDQEKFVWQNVCVGKEANFETTPGYGGQLDPKKPDGWPENRVLRPTFLENILLKNPYRSALKRQGVVIIGAWFAEPLDLSDAELPQSLVLQNSLIQNGADLSRVKSKYGIDMVNSKVAGTFSMYNIEIGSSLNLHNSEFEELNLHYARVGGSIELQSTKFSGTLNMPMVQVRGPLFMDEKAIFVGVNLGGATIEGDLDLGSSTVNGGLNMSHLRVRETLRMDEQAKFADVNLEQADLGTGLVLANSAVTGKFQMPGLKADKGVTIDEVAFAELDLHNAHISGQLELSRSTVTGTLTMTQVNVGGSLFMRELVASGEVYLRGAHIGGHLDMNGSTVKGTLHMDQLEADKSVGMGYGAKFADVDLDYARVGHALSLTESTVTGTLQAVSLRIGQDLYMSRAMFADLWFIGAHVGGRMYLNGAKVAGTLTCSGMELEWHLILTDGAKFDGPIVCHTAKIKGDLNLSGGSFGGNVEFAGADIGGHLQLSDAHWSDGAALVFRNTKISSIPDLVNGWSRKLDLGGFTYRSVGAADEFQQWFSKLHGYAPQPYYQLAAVVKNQGDSALATKVAYTGRERERTESSGAEWVWLTALKWLIGYGYYPQRAIFWAIGLVIVGALVFRVSGEGPRNGMPFGLAYSFDMLLPIIQLRKKHHDIDLQTWTRYYFYWHKIMGYVLASFLIAGLSGLTK